MNVQMNPGQLKAFLDAEFPQVADQFEIEAITQTGVDVRQKVTTADLRPGGTVSGPTMFALADVSVYLAILSRVGPKALAVTTSATIDFMRKPVANVDLIARCNILKLGRSLAVCDCLIFSENHAEPVARASMTYSLPPGQK